MVFVGMVRRLWCLISGKTGMFEELHLQATIPGRGAEKQEPPERGRECGTSRRWLGEGAKVPPEEKQKNCFN